MEALPLMDQSHFLCLWLCRGWSIIDVTLFKLFLTLGQLSNQLPLHKWMLQWSRCHESWANYGLEEPLLVTLYRWLCLCHNILIFLLLISAVSSAKDKNTSVSAGMLDHIMVENAGVKVALNRIAVVSVLDAHTLSVMPYDPTVRSVSFLGPVWNAGIS